jgi:hypothetical protein
MGKGLREYLTEATELYEGRKRVEVLSDGEKTRRALYDLKRQLDDLDQLTGFKYQSKKGAEPGKAVFEVTDPDRFDAILEQIEKGHGVSLKPHIVSGRVAENASCGASSAGSVATGGGELFGGAGRIATKKRRKKARQKTG